MSAPQTCFCNATGCLTCWQREYARRVYRAKAYGQWDPKGDKEQVRNHLITLRNQGVGVTAICEKSGVARSTVQRIIAGQNKWVSTSVEARLLAVGVDAAKRIDVTGSKRRLQALNAIGWSTYELAKRLGTSQDHVWSIMRRQTWVTAEVRDSIAKLYGELSMHLGPSDTIRTRAAAARYAPPLAWNNIDDPAERPHGQRRPSNIRPTVNDIDPVAVDRACGGDRVELTKAERFVVVARLRADGYSLRQIEDRTGITKAERYIERGAA